MEKKLACHTISWANNNLSTIIKDIAEIGFEGIEADCEKLISSDLSFGKIKSLLKEYKIDIIAAYQTLRLGHCDDFFRSHEYARCEALITMLGSIGIEYLVVGDPPLATNSDISLLAGNLDKLGSIAKTKEVQLCYHPHRGGIVENPDQIDKLLSLTSSEKLSLCFDTCHIYWGGGSLSYLLRRYIDRIAYIQFKDVQKRPFKFYEKVNDILKSMTIKRDLRAKLKYVGLRYLNKQCPVITEIGCGEINFLEIIQTLNDLRYDGWITIELDAPTIDPKASLGRCMDKVRELYNMI